MPIGCGSIEHTPNFVSKHMKKIGKYVIRGLLGRGGMGKIFKVEHPHIGKIAALKLLDPDPLTAELLGTGSIRAMFKSEAAKLAGLRHPNVVQILDYDEHAGKPFYLMEYYSNSLGRILGETDRPDRPSRKIRPERAIHYLRQTLSGLDAMHHCEILHRDVKPHNLLVTDEDTVKICDFGLSKLRGESYSGPPSLKIGSPWYAPPEQEENPDRIDFSADLYAGAVTFYRMLTGVLPAQPPLATARYNSDLNADWDRFIACALDPSPRRRFASAAEMLAALESLERSWQHHLAATCRLPEENPDRNRLQSGGTPAALRSRCVKMPPGPAREFFGTDRLWRPLGYLANHFEPAGDRMITDTATGLVWQRAGSRYPLTWQQAHIYVERLNQERFCDCGDWRLPTVAELLTLLNPPPRGRDYCLDPVFDSTQRHLWSCDRRSFIAAWYVSVDLAYVDWQDFSARFHVRAVRTLRR
jgi:serine/threonine-protein kinase